CRPVSTELPPALSWMWRLCRRGYRHEPRMMIAAFVLSQIVALPGALLALWLLALGRGVVQHRPALVLVSAAGMGLSSAATWLLGVYSMRVQRRVRRPVTTPAPAHRPGLRRARG